MPVRVGLKFIEKWQDSMENAVLEYEKEPIVKGQIVFYGPSNFTRWSKAYGMKPMREVLLGKSGAPCVINRGFGSSCPEHQLYYYPRMIRPLEPKVLVYASFGNSTAFGYSYDEAWELAQRVIAYSFTDFPDIRIYLCSAIPQKAMTEDDIAKRQAYNARLREFAEKTPNCFYIDTFEHAPLRNDDLFVEDGVHFNQMGYDIYAEIFKQELKDELDEF